MGFNSAFKGLITRYTRICPNVFRQLAWPTSGKFKQEYNYRSVRPTFHLMYRAFNKVKAIPLQAWTGPEDLRSLMLADFKTVDT